MERIEGLEQEHRDLMLGFKFQHGQGTGKALMDDQRAYFAKLNTPAVPTRRDKAPDSGQLLDELFTLGAMINKPVS